MVNFLFSIEKSYITYSESSSNGSGPLQTSVVKPLIVLVALMGLLFSAGLPSTYASTTITFDSAASNYCGSIYSPQPCPSTPPYTVTWSHTIGGGANRILIVGVSGEITLTPVSGIVYGPSSLTLLAAQNEGSIRAEAWYLLNPPTGTATITVTFSGAQPDAIGGSVSYFNVASVGGYNSAGGGGSDPITITVNANSGDLVTDVLAMYTGSLPSPGLGQTERWNVLANSGTPDGAGSDKPGSSPVTMTWTTSPYFGWALIGIQLQPPLSVATAAGGATACAVTDFGFLSGFSAVSVDSLSPAPPSGLTFPYGLLSITVSRLEPGQTVTVAITLLSPLPAGTFSYWKFQSGAWTQFPGASLDSTRTVITLTFTADTTGTINDPGGPAIPAPSVTTTTGTSATSATTATTATIIPEYPLGLPLLAIFMIMAYGLIKRRTRNPKNI